MTIPGYRGAPTEQWDAAAPVDPAEAEEFLRLYHSENPQAGAVEKRLAQVLAEIEATGTYWHTGPELEFGARVAWRNSSRCIGRLYWNSLMVLDNRTVAGSEAIFDRIVTHLRLANGNAEELPGGAIRPLISVFAPATPGHRYPRIWNEQLIRYAGYRTDAGTVGDCRTIEFTEAVTALGWRGKTEAFDVLPLAIETPDEGVRLFSLPDFAVLEVPLAHPEFGWFAELGLRWYAVPAISNMRLSIGGVSYPLAPFNGWYMGTEIGARNLADRDRYDVLPLVAARLRLDTSNEATLWRDQALVEVNKAVLWSFKRCGVKISDHHTESRRFLTHVEREASRNRDVPADWTWIVPPLASAATGVFHRYYHEADQRPNFYLDPQACGLAQTQASVNSGGSKIDRRLT